MVFGSKRDNKSDALSREDVVGNLYPDSLTSEVDVTPSPTEFRRQDSGNESVIDPHARFNGKYVSDRDLRIEGEAQGEIECQGTLIISPQARVRSGITAHNVIINGDYEGDVDCGGRFEIGSTGRVKGTGQDAGAGGQGGGSLGGLRDHDPRQRRSPPGDPGPAGLAGRQGPVRPASERRCAGRPGLDLQQVGSRRPQWRARSDRAGNRQQRAVGPARQLGKRRRSWSRSHAGIASSRAIAAG